MQQAQPRNDILAVLMTVGFLELIRTAWISDDAYEMKVPRSSAIDPATSGSTSR